MIYTYLHTYSTYTCRHKCICVCVYIYIHTYIYADICTYIYIYAYIHIYIYIDTHTYIHASARITEMTESYMRQAALSSRDVTPFMYRMMISHNKMHNHYMVTRLISVTKNNISWLSFIFMHRLMMFSCTGFQLWCSIMMWHISCTGCAPTSDKGLLFVRGRPNIIDVTYLGRQVDTVGNPDRVHICQFEIFELKFANSSFSSLSSYWNSTNSSLSSNSRQQYLSQQYPPPPL